MDTQSSMINIIIIFKIINVIRKMRKKISIVLSRKWWMECIISIVYYLENGGWNV